MIRSIKIIIRLLVICLTISMLFVTLYAQEIQEDATAKAEAEFLESCMGDMEKSWMETINDILSFLPYGYSVHELVFKKRRGIHSRDRRFRSKSSDGRWGWRKPPNRRG